MALRKLRKWGRRPGGYWPVITIVRGNILDSEAAALVDPVNTVGVAGKGLAKVFARRFPESAYYRYIEHCRSGRLQLGQVSHVLDKPSGKAIVFFPTKRHWRELSNLADIQDGLESLRTLITRMEWPSVAIPALGCGCGGLAWRKVLPAIEKALAELSTCNVMLYAPHEDP